MDREGLPVPSVVSRRLARLPCFELLCTNILSEMASNGPSTLTWVDITTWQKIEKLLSNKIYFLLNSNLPEIFSYHVDFQHFSNNFDYISKRILKRNCNEKRTRKKIIISLHYIKLDLKQKMCMHIYLLLRTCHNISLRVFWVFSFFLNTKS